MVLEKINQVNDIKKLKKEEIFLLANEIRQFLINKISVKGGHLASNLGVIELTMALHLAFDLPKDKIIWDVGHQSYTHKVLTGRKDEFDNLREFEGLSGFPKRTESSCDSFDTGHSSTSISAGLGIAHARDLSAENFYVVSVIGDGALTGGMAFEALNNASALKTNLIIVLNDNEMSISKNVGGMSEYLGHLRTSSQYTDLKTNVINTLEKIPNIGSMAVNTIRKTKSGIKQLILPGMLFENMDIKYLGPLDGYDIEKLVKAFNDAKKVNGPVIVHVVTKKGKGYLPAERHPSRFHGTGAFKVENGIPESPSKKSGYTDVFSTVMKKMGERDEKVVAITAAMADGTGLKRFARKFPDRFFDVGIAEQHGVTFAAGLAVGGLKPVFAVYSSFLQRAYDQVIHDVCMQNLHVVFAIDRAGLVGKDGQTHQGVFDLSYLTMMPNMTVMAPKNKWELSDMLKFALKYDGPIALRYPRGEAYDGLQSFRKEIQYGISEIIYDEDEIALLAVGNMVKISEKVRMLLKEKGHNVTLINARFVKPFDKKLIENLGEKHRLLVTLEENVLAGGFGQQVLAYINQENIDIKVLNIGIEDTFIEQGSVEVLQRECHIDAVSVADRIINHLRIYK
ncbi:1-deoxy-D-xylulose-5-phosphate synthase [Acetitomaculum ruminis DSM 5522]|uniref:1-deoxy-D-xylulose-5-phosphate synthase n=1 Tax=Acetitomaculum ruminis DSM 5522 TaxID=1120918 RepID=A0A1I0VT49_9FIRM|nr:1-deoxy-D-xylulose-5-phosphate synthase [Acetitomaculum ruminis]SFA79462.1 1-deoxy-D-xylulose-5-phosphate synthase [Acetitomaculum ruminis DSM 5522]